MSEIMNALRDLTASTTSALTDFRAQLEETVERTDRFEAALNRQALPGAGVGGDRALHEARSGLGKFAKTGIIDASASMSTGVDPDGGYLVRPELDTRIMQMQRNLSPIRRIAQVISSNAGTYTRPVSLGGTQSGWVSETEGRPETSAPKLGLLSFPANEVYAQPAVTQTILDDAEISVADYLIGEISREFSEREGDAFLLGDGVKRPLGLLAAPNSAADDATRALGTYQFLNSGNASAITADALIDFVYRLKVGYRVGASWLMNSITASAIRKLKDSNGQYLWAQSLQAGQPSTLLGFPVEIDEAMPDIAAGSFPVAFGDFRAGYLVVDRIGVRLLRDPYSAKPYVLFYATKRVGGGPLDTNAIKLLKISA